MANGILILSYLIGSVSFIIGLKMLSHPDSARKGNLYAAIGMTLAILATIFFYTDSNGVYLKNHLWIFGGLLIGSIVGTLAAKKVQMTAMPQMVSLFNGMGGACAAIISIVEFKHMLHAGNTVSSDVVLSSTILIGLVIGIVSFTGSMIAFGKLNGNINDKTLPLQQLINIGLLVLILVLVTGMVSGMIQGDPMTLMYVVLSVSALYGVLFVMPIGGADMPVVISLLNSFTGVAAAFGGFLYDNSVMLTGGILVGSAGTVLTVLMCKAMNRSLTNVIVGSFGGTKQTGGGGSEVGGTYKEISMNMNVLLAEADVSYDKLLDMDEINPEFAQTDVVLVLGANDVVNPAAKTDPASPIYGMPILNVEDASHVIVNKRSMKPGYAGIENALFFQPKTSMLFGDAKDALTKLVAEIKSMA